MAWSWNILNASYGEELQKSVSELTPDAGANFKRQTSTYTSEIVSGEILLTKAERQAFREFYIRDTNQGSMMFTFTDCRYNATRQAVFVGTPTERLAGDKFRISLTLRLGRLSGVRTVNWNVNSDNLIFNSDNAILGLRR